MCAFDTETTCADPEIARIVTASIVLIDGTGTTPADTRTWLINPGCEIPRESTVIHGITTEHAAEHGQAPGPALDEIADALTGAALAGIPIIAFNACFDLTVLDRNTRREGLEPFTDRFPPVAPVVDPWVLDKHLDPFRKGKRTLSALCDHYGVRLDGAHDAAFDAVAAARVAWMIAQRYPRIAHTSLAALYDLQAKARAGQAQSFAVWLQSQGKAEVIEKAWPVKAWAGEKATV